MTSDIIKIRDLKSSVAGQQILKGINLDIKAGEIHVIMGPNGAGKSTLANVLMGHPAHTVDAGEVTFMSKDLLAMKVDERAKTGLFLSFQYPEEVPGVTVENFLRTAKKEVAGIMPMALSFKKELQSNMEMLNMDSKYLERYLNQGFSGGEKKKNEILQMAVLKPKLAILDETDSGLDIDAIRVVYESVQKLSSADNAILIITHYNKILSYITPDYVHVLVDGRIVRSGDVSLAEEIESKGYEQREW
ncbi:Fe-S cluster assembly ATPase SufC [Fusibacter sp. 3D3]|uniref:Fe-S cluster assembly ATPase SufC n=1 Tax=Fusibacter sp. 3D3 TaxID=1048380 RepID=UPI00085300EF|nr:Fe-S cluster assembly ATPase SufC [Fusibacter sp. 3D3]GAU76806.1 iron-sulfur cluster assembly ATPase protein SufC [Fusibacter sp. 3D3]